MDTIITRTLDLRGKTITTFVIYDDESSNQVKADIADFNGHLDLVR
jgi:hypothetical protein